MTVGSCGLLPDARQSWLTHASVTPANVSV
jgi:hypothetical protein